VQEWAADARQHRIVGGLDVGEVGAKPGVLGLNPAEAEPSSEVGKSRQSLSGSQAAMVQPSIDSCDAWFR
jgi:hypothetical protein